MNRIESGPSKRHPKRHPKRSRNKPPRPDGIGHRSTKPIGKVRLLAGRPSLALFLPTLALVLADPGLRLLNVSSGCDSRRGYEPHAPSFGPPRVALEARASPSWQIPGKHLLSVSSGCDSRRGDDSAQPPSRRRAFTLVLADSRRTPPKCPVRVRLPAGVPNRYCTKLSVWLLARSSRANGHST